MIRIKVCGLTLPGDAMEVSKAGADLIGFNFYRGSKRFVGDDPPPDLFSKISPHTLKAGVFVDEDREKIIGMAARFDLDVIQLHGGETADFCRSLKLGGLKVIKAFGLGSVFEPGILTPYLGTCDFFLFDTQTSDHGGSGVMFRWELLRDYDLAMPFFLSGGIAPESVPKIKDFHHKAFYGVDINSRFETSPGVKNTVLVKTFIQNLKRM